jgi:hypothetical protein
VTPGDAVRMAAPNYWWDGVIVRMRARGRAEVVITNPGDSAHNPGDIVIGGTHALEPLRGRAAEREQARAQAMFAPLLQTWQPAERAGEGPLQPLLKAIQERGFKADVSLDAAVAYLGQRVEDGCQQIADSIDLASLRGRDEDTTRRRWWRR